MNYLKCLVVNRCALVGVLLLLVCLPASVATFALGAWGWHNLCSLLAIIGFSLFAVTGCGMVTLYAYKRTKKHIVRFGRVDKSFDFIAYCGECGRRLAAKEAGVAMPPRQHNEEKR